MKQKIIILTLAIIILIPVLIILLIIPTYLFAFQPCEIKGESMSPNFSNGELWLVDKVSYKLNSPTRGDVALYNISGDASLDFLGRIIGLPGEKISIQDGNVYINDEKLEESYLPEGRETHDGTFLSEGKTLTIPDNHYFIIGDNRSYSRDSRDASQGFIAREDIKGRFWFCYANCTEDN